MSFYSDQFHTNDFEFQSNTPIDLLSKNELNSAVQLASILGRGTSSILFFLQENEPIIKASFGIDQTQDFLPILSKLDSSAEGLSATLPESIEAPGGLKISGCVWFRSREGKAVGGIALFSKEGAPLERALVDGLDLIGKNLLDSLAQKAKLQRFSSFEKIFNFSNDFVCIVDFQGSFEKNHPAIRDSPSP